VARIYPFKLEFKALAPGGPEAAFFPFIMDGTVAEGITCLVSSRSAGDMGLSPRPVSESGGTGGNPYREALFRALGLDARRVAALRQVHSRNVLEAGLGRMPFGAEADGMICRNGEIFLSISAADCLPVFLYDAGGSGGFGLVHSGWKGTGIALRALRLMEEKWGVRSEETAAVLGPCIRSCCYRVDGGRAGAFEAEFGGSGGEYPLGRVTEERAGEFFINLQAANARLLASAGVRNIAVCEDCTFTDERLGSFRREGAGFTRMAVLLGRLGSAKNPAA
jgi:YfiH family protein